MMVPMGMGDTFSRNFRKMNHSLKDRLIRHMEDGRYEPQSKSELARALNVDSRQKLDFRALVDQMEEEGKLVRLQKGRYALKRERRNLVHGMIRILRSGKILFLPRKGDPAAAALGWDTEAIPELELKPNRLGTALDGDRVAVRGSDGSDFTTRKVVYMNVPSIVSDIPVGARMLIADGELEIRVVGKNDTELDCEFVVGGAMRSRKSVNVPCLACSGKACIILHWEF